MTEGIYPEALLAHAGWLRALARGLVQDEHVADEVVQETWVAALQESRSPRCLRSWLTVVARNFARLDRRREQRVHRREQRAARPEAVAPASEALVERAELHRQLVDRVLDLDEPSRSTVLLHYYEGLSVAEIARVQDTNESTVKTRLRRARLRLREQLDHLEPHWRVMLLPLGAGPVSSLASTGAVSTTATSSNAIVTPSILGGTILSVQKILAVSVLLAAGLLGWGGWALYQSTSVPPAFEEDRSQARAEPESPEPETSVESGDSKRELGRSAGGTDTENDPSPAAEGSTVQDPGEDGDVGRARDLEPGHPVDAGYESLKQTYQESNWYGVKNAMVDFRALLTDDAGMESLIALIDAEEDPWFLEALLNHLVGAPRDGDDRRALDRILQNEFLHAEIWTRFEEGDDPLKRMSLLTFFTANPRLRGQKLDALLQISEHDPAERVRARAISALSEMARRPDVVHALCETAERDVSASCRAATLSGLARIDDERARGIVRAAFTDPSEEVRTAALESRAGSQLPASVTAGDPAGYLVGEFRRATTDAYRSAVIDRLLEADPDQLSEELRAALDEGSPGYTERYYRSVIELVQGGITDRDEMHRQIRPLFTRFRYSGR